MIFELGIVDLRDEIAEFERKHRPFPPRSGSVSKPFPRLRPLPELLYKRIQFEMRVTEGEFGRAIRIAGV